MSYVSLRTYCLFFLHHEQSRGSGSGSGSCTETSAESRVVMQKKICCDLVYACLAVRPNLGHGDHPVVRSFCFGYLSTGAFVAGDSLSVKEIVYLNQMKSVI